jgi:hypothetical protein
MFHLLHHHHHHRHHQVVGPSGIPGAGRGVFAQRDFRKGTLITEYQGTKRQRTELEDEQKGQKHCYE